MRQFAAQATGGNQDWDWRVSKNEEELKEESQKLQNAITKIREMLK